MSRSWLVTGAHGQLGTALCAHLAAAGVEVEGVDLEVDIADPAAIRAKLATRRFDGVLNAAAFTQVDRCEREPEAAARANAEGPAVLAHACRDDGIALVHVSTDYVFDGQGTRPYREDDPPAPRSAYGRTKLAGEHAVLAASPSSLVVRTSWVFGRGRNFLAAILDQAAKRRSGEASGPLRVVDDQRGRPTYAVDLAAGIWGLVEVGAVGLYHVANEGVATWWELARFCLDEAGCRDLLIDKISTGELRVDAPRPAWSVLDTSKARASGIALRPWQDAVRAYLRSDASPLRGAAWEGRR
ncbi:MAG TPA: dTDP-4-dehydrorhamnose reductase [Myxococcota bacterium]|nr:dTDP-4-dehydrorhamnose reductase [Myxococcota bacterium]